MPESTEGLLEVISAHVEGGASYGHAVVQLLQIAANCAVRHSQGAAISAETLSFAHQV